jgi:cytochrome c5
MMRPAKVISLAGILLAFSSVCAAADRQEEGRKAYEANCASCHETGTDGAPSTRKAEDWTERSNLWESVLFEHANEGYLKMPGKGGNSTLSEYEVDVAAEYMLNITHPDMPRD